MYENNNIEETESASCYFLEEKHSQYQSLKRGWQILFFVFINGTSRLKNFHNEIHSEEIIFDI